MVAPFKGVSAGLTPFAAACGMICIVASSVTVPTILPIMYGAVALEW